MYSGVINYIKKLIDISDVELEEGLKYSVSKSYPKGDYIIRIDEHCRFTCFINKGLMVTTTADDKGKESVFDVRKLLLYINRGVDEQRAFSQKLYCSGRL